MPKQLGNGSAWKDYPKEYDSFNKARRRCEGKMSAADTKNYLERGIEFRFATFWDFFECVGPRPAGYTLNRIDNDGHYEPGNVEWADPVRQARNRTNSRLITYQGKEQTLADWCEELGLNYARTYARIYKLNLSASDALASASRYEQRS